MLLVVEDRRWDWWCGTVDILFVVGTDGGTRYTAYVGDWWCGTVDILLLEGDRRGDWWCGIVGIRLVVWDCRHIVCGVGLCTSIILALSSRVQIYRRWQVRGISSELLGDALCTTLGF